MTVKRAAVLLASLTLLGACGGGDPVSFEGSTLVWAIDDEPVGDTIDYDTADEDRRRAGLVLVMQFSTDGSDARVSSDLTASISLDSQRLQGTASSVRSEIIPTDGFELIESTDGFTITHSFATPTSAAELERDRSVLLAAGIDEDVVDSRSIKDRGEDGKLAFELSIEGTVSLGGSDIDVEALATAEIVGG